MCGNSDEGDDDSNYLHGIFPSCVLINTSLTNSNTLLFLRPLLNLCYFPRMIWNLLADISLCSLFAIQFILPTTFAWILLNHPSEHRPIFSKEKMSPQNKIQIPSFRWWSSHKLATVIFLTMGFRGTFTGSWIMLHLFQP